MGDEPTQLGGNAKEDLKRRAQRRVDVLNQIDDLKDELKAFKEEDKEDGYTEKALGQVVKEMRKGVDHQADQLQLELEVTTYRDAVGLPTTFEQAQKLALAASESPEPKLKPKGGGKRSNREKLN